ncbi:centromere protein P [Gadus macrocephalus]|uniref:centromere protein P n=1 Tax=Gadus macrocephalus TaxID=80720 RepID=UPI0028CBB7C2|nr:centromere protein P [Gadus macrocephalus]XP_059924814.1 centromere protein P [Gadus macrocephalus]XP_059924815.1 centromere protein P [Gadus macrocephalus]
MLRRDMETARRLEFQSKALQAEIDTLRSPHTETEGSVAVKFKGRMKDALLSLSGKQTAEETMRKMRAEVEEMEEDLERQTEMNGISLTSCTVKTLHKDDTQVVQQYSLAGSCLDLGFQVEFQLSEAQGKTITKLDIVLDTDDMQISSFTSRAEERCELIQFFRTLRSFSEGREDRRRTFHHFQEKYPSVVSLPEGLVSEVMTLSPPELPSCVLAVHWSVMVSKEGEVIPQIHLLPRAPKKEFLMDSAGTLEGAPESFHSLLSVLGIEAALENIILALSR